VSPTCQTPFFTFFAFTINEMGEPEEGAAEPLPLPTWQVRKAIENRGI
jgi:hypothetical protein